MYPVAQVLDTVNDMLDAVSKDKKQRVRQVANSRYFDIVRAFPYGAFRRLSENQTYDGTDGLRLPACLAGILDIWDSEGNVYQERTRDQIVVTNSDLVPRWYVSSVSAARLRILEKMDLDHGETTVAGGTFTAGEVGEWIAIDRWPAVWQVLTTSSITPAWGGEDQTSKPIQVRPAGSKVIKLVDEQGDALGDATDISYSWWRMPMPLFQDHDMVLLPAQRPLELAILVTMLDRDKRREDANAFRQEMAEEIAKMLGMEPEAHVPGLPQDLTGLTAGYGVLPSAGAASRIPGGIVS